MENILDTFRTSIPIIAILASAWMFTQTNFHNIMFGLGGIILFNISTYFCIV
ncbi:hypothetical protein CTK_C22230 [Clostridium tyrobutyricum]|nr:hypothetical protein CTK_C22230 [Clostridium tyrobutyricum]